MFISQFCVFGDDLERQGIQIGADIHVYVEVVEKHAGGYEKNDEYILCVAEDVFFGRNYILFGLMAGVRGTKTLFEPKGLPENISSTVSKKNKEWGVDAHSHSWLSIEELWKIKEEYETENERYPYLDAILAMMVELETENDIPRLILWFDS